MINDVQNYVGLYLQNKSRYSTEGGWARLTTDEIESDLGFLSGFDVHTAINELAEMGIIETRPTMIGSLLYRVDQTRLATEQALYRAELRRAREAVRSVAQAVTVEQDLH